MATQKDIAEYLQISQQAVSASLRNSRGSTKVSMETRHRVLTAARELGYVANHVARSFRSGKTYTIGVIMPYSRDPYYSAVIDALSLEAVQRRYSLMLQFHFWSPEEEEQALRRMAEARVDGIFIHPRGKVNKRMEEAIKAIRPPVVAISGTVNESYYHGVVEKDYEQEGYLAAQELLRLGHRRIDVLAANLMGSAPRRRMKGIELAIRNTGVEATARYVVLDSKDLAKVEQKAPAPIAVRNALGPLLARQYFDTVEHGTAVLVGNEIVAWKLIAEAAKRRISVPGELSILCAGVMDEGDSGPLPLTALEYDAMEIASAAFEIFLEGREVHRTVVPRLVCRQSTAPPPVGRSFQDVK